MLDEVAEREPAREPAWAATVLSHEIAHAWIGGIVDSRVEDGWFIEALTTYLSRTAVATLLPGSRPWATSRSAAAPDAGYARDAQVIKQLADTIGQDGILQGLRSCLHRFAGRTVGWADLLDCCSQASGHDLSAWTARPTGVSVPSQPHPHSA